MCRLTISWYHCCFYSCPSSESEGLSPPLFARSPTAWRGIILLQAACKRSSTGVTWTVCVYICEDCVHSEAAEVKQKFVSETIWGIKIASSDAAGASAGPADGDPAGRCSPGAAPGSGLEDPPRRLKVPQRRPEHQRSGRRRQQRQPRYVEHEQPAERSLNQLWEIRRVVFYAQNVYKRCWWQLLSQCVP